MAKKLNVEVLNNLVLGLDTKASKKTQEILSDNNEYKNKEKEINNFLNTKLIKEKEKRIVITISSYESLENKYKEMKNNGFNIDKSTIYRNAINTIYENWKQKK